MYAKCMVLFCLFGLSALLSAQSADQNRINIRIFPSQVLSITTAKDLQNTHHINTIKQAIKEKELLASNLYGYQIKLLNESQFSTKNIDTTKVIESKANCNSQSTLIYSKYSSGINQKISTSHIINSQKEAVNKCFTSQSEKMLVYLIITQ